MTRTVITVFAVALLVAPLATPQPASAAASQAAQGAVEKELIALDKKIEDAIRTRDASTLGNLLTDDFRQVVPAGVRTKAELLKAIATPPANPAPPPPPLEPSYTVHVYGDTALMTHATKQTDAHHPAPGGGARHVFVRQQGAWKMAGTGSAPPQLSPERSVNAAAYALMADGKLKEATSCSR